MGSCSGFKSIKAIINVLIGFVLLKGVAMCGLIG